MMMEDVVVVTIWCHIADFRLNHTNQRLHWTDKTEQKMRHIQAIDINTHTDPTRWYFIDLTMFERALDVMMARTVFG